MNHKDLIKITSQVKENLYELRETLSVLNEIYSKPNPYDPLYKELVATVKKLLQQIEQLER